MRSKQHFIDIASDRREKKKVLFIRKFSESIKESNTQLKNFSFHFCTIYIISVYCVVLEKINKTSLVYV